MTNIIRPATCFVMKFDSKYLEDLLMFLVPLFIDKVINVQVDRVFPQCIDDENGSKV